MINDGDTYAWMSPDIFLLAEDGHEIELGQPLRPDTDYRVGANIHNLGRQDAINVSVKFYWRDYGIVEPTGYSQLGDTVYISNLAGQTSIAVTSSETWNSSSEGHKCILVNASHYFDPISGNEFNIDDRHVAQRNLKIEQIEVGSTKTFTIKAGLSHQHKQSKKRQILVRPTYEATEFKLIKSIFKNNQMHLSFRPMTDFNFKVGRKIGALGSLMDLKMDPDKNYDIDFTVTAPANAKKGETWLFHVFQQQIIDHRRAPRNKRSLKPIIDNGCTIIISVH